MEERAFKGVWIPAEVWLSDELTIYEKAVFAEIDSLDGENHCWASNEYLAKFCKMSEVTISRAISNLIRLGFIERLSFDGRQRVLAINKSRLISQTRETYLKDKSELSPSENLLLIENKKDNNREGTVAGASSKNRSFRNHQDKLTDDLQSGKDIDEQKKSEKKSPKDKFKDECLDIIEKEYSDETKDLLIEYFNFVTAVPENKDNLCKRVKTTKAWRHKLDRLDDLVKEGYDCKKLIQQSLDKKQYVFYPLQLANSSKKGKETLNDKLVVSDPEWARAQIQKAIDNEEEFY